MLLTSYDVFLTGIELLFNEDIVETSYGGLVPGYWYCTDTGIILELEKEQQLHQ